jgi:hypothetical protein
MRRLLLASSILLAITAVAAVAEPPPQVDRPDAVAAAPAPAMTLAAVTVTQADTTAVVESSSVRQVDTARAQNLAPDKSDGHGLGFWAIAATVVALLIAAYFVYRYLTRAPATSTGPRSEYEPPVDRTRGPSGGGGRKHGTDD